VSSRSGLGFSLNGRKAAPDDDLSVRRGTCFPSTDPESRPPPPQEAGAGLSCLFRGHRRARGHGKPLHLSPPASAASRAQPEGGDCCAAVGTSAFGGRSTSPARHLVPPDPEAPLRTVRHPRRRLSRKDSALFESAYTFSEQSDRMATDGGAEHPHGRARTCLDAIPPERCRCLARQAIVMLADRQTTGGYTKIALVATADLAVLAQAHAGRACASSGPPRRKAPGAAGADEPLDGASSLSFDVPEPPESRVPCSSATSGACG
jgi:hypothetical protein